MRIGLSNIEIKKVTHFQYNNNVRFFLDHIDYSKEHCGAILGYINNTNTAVIENIEMLTNYASENDNFYLNINELHTLNTETNKRVIGIFHNHIYNYDTSLSDTDRFFQSLYPFIWLVSAKNIQEVIEIEVCTHQHILKWNK